MKPLASTLRVASYNIHKGVRGLLHVTVKWAETTLHAMVAGFGLMHASRVRQAQSVLELIDYEVPSAEPVFGLYGLSRAHIPGLKARGPGPGADLWQAPVHLRLSRAGLRFGPLLHPGPALRDRAGTPWPELGAPVGPPTPVGRV